MDLLINKLWSNKIIRIGIIAVLAVLAALSLIQGCKNAYVYSQDFQWDAAKAFAMRIDPYDESLSPTGALSAPGIKEFYDYYNQIGAPQKMEANQFPSLLMLLIPMTFMAPSTARCMWIVLNVLFTAGIIFLLRRTFFKAVERDIFIVLMLIMIAGTPYRNQLGVGQHTLFAFFFFMLAVYLMDKAGSIFTSSVCLAISYFKYTLTAPLALYFIYKKKYKEFVISIAIHIVLTVFAAFYLDESAVDMIVKPLVVSSKLASEGGLDFGALMNGSPLSYIFTLSAVSVMLYLAVRLPEGRDIELISVLCLWSLIILYHRTYDFWVMIVAAALPAGIVCKNYLKYLYAAVLFVVFFVLRIFSESFTSIAFAAVLYYALTILFTVFVIRQSVNMNAKRGQ